MYFYYGVQVLDSTTDEPIVGIGVEMNAPDEEENWVTSECQWTTDGDGYAWGCWNLNYDPQTVTAGAGGAETGYNYNSVEVGPVVDAAWNGTDSISTQLHLTVSSVTPTLTFTATSGTIAYDGTRKVIGTVSYNGGNGYAYYLVKTTSSVPSASSTEGTGWVQINTGGDVYATSSAPSNVGTYYVFLKATAHGNYAAVNPKSGGNKAISRATATLTVTAVGTIYYNGSTQVLGTINYNGDGTAYYIVSTSTTTPSASDSGWTPLLSSGQNVSSTEATAQNYYIYLRSTQGTNYNAVNPKRAATKAISKATPGITVSGQTKIYDGNTYFVTANAPTNCATPSTLTQPAGTIYYDTSSGATTYSISVPNAGGSEVTNLTGSNNNMGQKDVGAKTVYAFFQPTDTTNYNNSTNRNGKVTIDQATPTVTITADANSTYPNPGPKVYVNVSVPGTVYWGTTSSSMTNTQVISASQAGTAVQFTQNTTPGTQLAVYLYFVPTDTTNYKNVGSSSSPGKSKTGITYNKANGNVGTVSNPASQTYKESGTYSFQLAMSGNTGTVTYPTTITVKQGSTTITGWSCTTAGVVTVPAATNAASYTVTGGVTCAESTNYKAVTTAQSITWTITIDKKAGTLGAASTIAAQDYKSSGTYSFQLAVGTSTGTVTYPTSITVSGSQTGWTCTTAGVLTVPAGTNAGSYTVTGNCTVAASTNYNAVSATARTWTITINKATGYLTATTTNRTYTGSEQVIAAIATYSGAYYFGLGSSTTVAPTSWGSQNQSLKATTVGTYYVWAKCNTSTNYLAVDAKYIGTVTISQAATSSPNLTAGSGTYNGTTTYYAKANNVGGNPAGTIYYGATSGATTYSYSVVSGTTKPTNLSYMGRSAAGTTTIYAFFRPTDTTNYSDSSVVSTTVTVAQATGSVTISNASQSYKSGGALASVSGATGTMHYKLDSGSWGTSVPTATSGVNAGNHTLYYYVDASSDGNYTALGSSSSPQSLTVTVSKVTPVVSTNPTKVSNWTYDKTAHNLLSGGAYKHSSSDSTAVAGSFAYAQATNAGSYTSLTWTFTPTDTTNYNTATGSITGTVTVSPKGVTTQWGVLTWTYDGSTHSTTCGLVSGGVISGDTCTISLSGNSVGPNVGTATVTATLSNSNYTISSGGSSQTLTINQATPTLTFTYDPSATTTYSAAGPKVLITASVAGTVYWGTTSASSGMTNTKAVSAGTATQLTQNTTPGTTIKVYAYFVPTDTTNYKNVGSSTSAGATSSNVTYNKASNQITVSPTSVTVYYRTGYTTATITVSNYKGTVTAVSSASGKVSVTKVSNSSFTVQYVAVGSATITFTDDGGTNYTSSTATCTVTAKQDAVASISLTVGKKALTVGETTSITATATYETGVTSDVTSSATYSSSPTNKVDVKKGNTVTGIYVDYGLYDYGFVVAGGYDGIREWYNEEGYLCDKYFVAAGTITYGSSTKYLWQNTDDDSVSDGAPAYVVTNSNDPATLLGMSVKYNLNNLFTESIVATLTSDRSTYESPTLFRIWDID